VRLEYSLSHSPFEVTCESSVGHTRLSTRIRYCEVLHNNFCDVSNRAEQPRDDDVELRSSSRIGKIGGCFALRCKMTCVRKSAPESALRVRELRRSPQVLLHRVLQSRPAPSLLLAASAGRAAGVALEAGAVADQGKVSALLASFAFVTLHPRFTDQIGLAPFSECLDGARYGLRES